MDEDGGNGGGEGGDQKKKSKSSSGKGFFVNLIPPYPGFSWEESRKQSGRNLTGLCNKIRFNLFLPFRILKKKTEYAIDLALL